MTLSRSEKFQQECIVIVVMIIIGPFIILGSFFAMLIAKTADAFCFAWRALRAEARDYASIWREMIAVVSNKSSEGDK